MAYCGFVHSVLHLTCFDVVYGFCYILSYRAALGVGHQSLRTEKLTYTAYKSHHIGACDADVEIKPVFGLNLLYDFLRADEVRSRLGRFVRFFALGYDKNADGFARSVGKNHNASDLLVGMTGVNAQSHVQLQGFVKLGFRRLESQFYRLSRFILFGPVYELCALYVSFTLFIAKPSSVNHDNAHAAGSTGYHAASRFQGRRVEVYHFVLAISSICALVMLATFVLLGTADAVSMPHAF